MEVKVLNTSDELGKAAAAHAAEVLRAAIKERGRARLTLSTGASQLDFLKHFVQADVDWSKVEMFHLDEYVDLPETHPASFRKYLKERFLAHATVGRYELVNGEGDIRRNIEQLNARLNEAPVDLALIGIGENAHVAFNDPPADFDTEEPYLVVDLAESCKRQQVGEGWFRSIEEVPKQAITMSIRQILKSAVIISCVPYQVKANAIKLTQENEVTNQIPSTILKTHPQWTLYLDKDSVSAVDSGRLTV
ncbi:6-phosphogluconolactonase [Paenibacillus allorhizosphaerae]|uniref:Glucosamine-6-phosphate deaminase n=1 Tax=Paenibacillus allorhizosphaerae TaxID=2849866 RepID=A0ABM8VGB5_9BACL|nr:6-phosphogluconolactonase [Paenibacillus allorhizosphaerae]CAG7637935.1 Glucosamine-6-phosphate deaminase [Paenibacillus allorhizosphaerae]